MFPVPLRIVPILVIAAVPLLGLKLYDVVAALAAQAVVPAEAKPVTPPQAAPAPSAAPAASQQTAAAPPAARPKPAAAPRDPASFSPGEITLLEALSHRRAELDRRAAELDERTMVLKATEQKISEKISELKQLQANIDKSLQDKDAKDAARINNLVRIYQLMKPQDAARIFEQLDMPVLIEVVAQMSEAKAAPILAAMQPEKAKAITLALAERHHVTQP